VSRTLRVRLRVAATAGRVGTRPTYRGAQTADASFSSVAAMLGFVTNGKLEKQQRLGTYFWGLKWRHMQG